MKGEVVIQAEVIERHIASFPDELSLIKKIEPDFDITWARRYNEFNAQVSVYFIRPLPHISEAFGFEQEICLLYSSYEKIQARTVQALDKIMSQVPSLGRVDQATAIIVSEDGNLHSWLRDYSASNPQSRIIIGITAGELSTFEDPWDLRNAITKQLYSRDLFDYSLPIDNDIFFFGRAADVAEHVDAIRRSENRGLFGLRKSGKTSLLFKIERECKRSDITTIYLDCKLPYIYRQNAEELLDSLSKEISGRLKLGSKGWSGQKDAFARFYKLIQRLESNTRICVIIDEIEYISFFSPIAEASHWKTDFIPFWQTIWSSQSQYRNLCFIVTGVNASVVEIDSIGAVQNPMFGIVKHRYLQGLDAVEVHQMVKTLGRRMGLKFDIEASHFLHARYGGHPLVTRMICSHIHSQIRAEQRERPFAITREFVEKNIDDREEEVIIYCNHIVSELRLSYPDEYDMLEMLAVDDIDGFNEFAEDPALVRHLRGYGLVDFSKPFLPVLKIPVLKKFVAREWRRRTGKKALFYVAPVDARPTLVQSRCSSVLRDLRSLDKRFALVGTPQLFGEGGPAEAEKFSNSAVVTDMNSLTGFLIQAVRSLIEPIDKYGRRQGRGKEYFYNDLKVRYPDLWDSLNRIRAYRNWLGHLDLTPSAEEAFRNYLLKDLKGRDPERVPDGHFIVQAACLNNLAVSLQSTFAQYE